MAPGPGVGLYIRSAIICSCLVLSYCNCIGAPFSRTDAEENDVDLPLTVFILSPYGLRWHTKKQCRMTHRLKLTNEAN